MAGEGERVLSLGVFAVVVVLLPRTGLCDGALVSVMRIGRAVVVMPVCRAVVVVLENSRDLVGDTVEVTVTWLVIVKM